jgi:hypothetical protein
MHKQVGSSLLVFNQFGAETVRIQRVYEYPNGGIAYGFYSHNVGRNLLKDCDCVACTPLHTERASFGKHFIGDAKRGVLIQL